MTTPAFNPDDPRLTAFVLGEIGDDDRAEIEQLLEASPDAQAAVKEIEETIGVLRDGLSSEPVPALTAEQRAAVEEQLAGAESGATATPALTAMAPARETEVPQRGFVRPGRGFGKLAGVVASVCALGLLVAMCLPAVQNASSSRYGDLVATNSTAESEESFGSASLMAEARNTADDADAEYDYSKTFARSSFSSFDGADHDPAVQAELAPSTGSFGTEPKYSQVKTLAADAGRVLVELNAQRLPSDGA